MTNGPQIEALMQLRSRLVVHARLVFETGWRIGSGREGHTYSDLGVLLDPYGQPVLPGSSLKGKLRSTCEQLASALGLTACMLDRKATGVNCVSDVNYHREVRSEYAKVLSSDLATRLRWIGEHTCDVCKLFGSPLFASRLRISDGHLEDWPGIVEVRDGVVIDRDSQTAVDGLKYDYEVVPAGTSFRITIEVDNPTEADEALLGAALFEWAAGSAIGGFTSRGLGRFRLQDIQLQGVDMTNAQERFRYLTRPDARYSDRADWRKFFEDAIRRIAASA